MSFRSLLFWIIGLILVLAGIGIGYGFNSWQERRRRAIQVDIVAMRPATRRSMYVIVGFSFVIAVASYLFYELMQRMALEASGQDKSVYTALSQFSLTLFGLVGVSLIGQIVFEVALRQQLLEQTTRALGDILLKNETTFRQLYAPEEIDKIINMSLKARTNPVVGTALYQFLSHFLGGKEYRPSRRDFDEEVILRPFEGIQTPQVSHDYYIVEDRLRFKSSPLGEYITLGCARTSNAVNDLFNDNDCIYRWEFRTDATEFKALMETHFFKADVWVNGKMCPTEAGSGDFIANGDGYKLRFKNPCFSHGTELNGLVDDDSLCNVRIDVTAIKSKQERYFTVFLAYPVNTATIRFTFGEAKIHGVEVYPMTTFNNPQIEPYRDHTGNLVQIRIDINEPDWIFPDGGFMFKWI